MKDLYNELNDGAEKKMEVVFVSSDDDEVINDQRRVSSCTPKF